MGTERVTAVDTVAEVEATVVVVGIAANNSDVVGSGVTGTAEAECADPALTLCFFSYSSFINGNNSVSIICFDVR